MATEKKYHDRSSSEDEEGQPFIGNEPKALQRSASPLSKTFHIILSATVLVALTLAVSSLTIVTTRPAVVEPVACSTPPPPAKHASESHATSPFNTANLDPEILDCGSSMEEALAKGCVYDSMMPGWTPERCYNRTLELEYRGDWKWYTTQAATHEIPWSLVETGRYRELWANHEYHSKHCLYMWRKTALALDQEGTWVNGMLLKSTHTEHCLRILDNWHVDPENPTSANVYPGFQSCRRVNWPGLKLRPDQMKDVSGLPEDLKGGKDGKLPI